MKNSIKNKHVLFVVENNSVPFDTRVWNEARSIRKICDNVSVICQKPRNESASFKIIDGIKIYMYPNPIQGSGVIGLIIEYIAAFFFISLYSLLIYIKTPYNIVHIANPPDFLSMIYFPYKLFNVKIIFDHHDPSPELFYSKFEKRGVLYKLMIILERISYKISDYVITVNDLCRKVTAERNKKKIRDIVVVSNCPNLPEMKINEDKHNKNKGYYIIVYLGIIGKRDNLEKLVHSIEYIVIKKQFKNFRVLVIGDGPNLSNVKDLVNRKKLKPYFIFHGFEYDKKKLYSLLSTADICVDSEEYNEESKIATPIKIMEYMAVGKPIIQYNMGGGKSIAGRSSLYVQNNDEELFGDAILKLLADEKTREKMGKIGRKRIEEKFQWAVQEKKLINLYYKVMS